MTYGELSNSSLTIQLAKSCPVPSANDPHRLREQIIQLSWYLASRAAIPRLLQKRSKSTTIKCTFRFKFRHRAIPRGPWKHWESKQFSQILTENNIDPENISPNKPWNAFDLIRLQRCRYAELFRVYKRVAGACVSLQHNFSCGFQPLLVIHLFTTLFSLSSDWIKSERGKRKGKSHWRNHPRMSFQISEYPTELISQNSSRGRFSGWGYFGDLGSALGGLLSLTNAHVWSHKTARRCYWKSKQNAQTASFCSSHLPPCSFWLTDVMV